MLRFSNMIFIAMLFTAVFIMAVGYLRFFYIPSKAEENVLWSISSLGFDDLKIGDIEQENGEIIIRNISFDKGDFSTIETMTIRFGLFDFLFKNKPVSSVVIDGMALTGEITKDLGLTLSGFGVGDDLLRKLSEMNIRHILLKNSKADILSDVLGGISVSLEGQIDGSAQPSFIGNIQCNQKNLSFSSKVSGSTDDNGVTNLDINAEDLSLETASYAFRRGLAKGVVKFDNALAPSYFMNFEFPSAVYKTLPLKHVILVTENDSLRINGQAFGDSEIHWSASLAHEDAENIEISIKTDKLGAVASYLKKSGHMHSDFNIPDLLSDRLMISDIIVTIPREPKGNKGGFVIQSDALPQNIIGDFEFNDDGNQVFGSAKLKKTNLSLAEIDLIDLDISGISTFTINMRDKEKTVDWNAKAIVENGKIKFSGLTVQPITGKFSFSDTSFSQSGMGKGNKWALKFGLPVKPHIKNSGGFELEIRKDNSVNINRAKYNIYGGELSFQSPIIEADKIRPKNKITISDLNLHRFFSDSELPGVIAWGKIGGVLPVTFNETNIDVKNGILQSQDSGIIRIEAHIISSLFPGETDKIRKIRQVLRNYHYEYFEIRLDGNMNERVLMTLNSRGYNPDLKDKDPIDINLQIETQISLLFEKLLK